MSRLLFLFFVLLVLTGSVSGQNNSGSLPVPRKDTVPLNIPNIQGDTALQNVTPIQYTTDSVSKMPRKDTGWVIDPATSFFHQKLSWQLFQRHPYFGFSAPPITVLSDKRHFNGKEFIFYLLVALLLIYALLRRAFPKYFKDLFRLFFRTTLKQRQISEQLMETPLPSLLLNGFFVVTGGLYITFLLQHFKINPIDNFWLMFLYCILGLSVVYLTKFIGLKISGWLFNTQESTNSYIFIVFIINKMIGILLIPFLIVLAFSTGNIYTVGLTLSWCMVLCLLMYRIFLTFGAVRNQVKVNPFHFFLYICAFEIAPLLLIYKGFLLFFRITA